MIFEPNVIGLFRFPFPFPLIKAIRQHQTALLFKGFAEGGLSPQDFSLMPTEFHPVPSGSISEPIVPPWPSLTSTTTCVPILGNILGTGPVRPFTQAEPPLFSTAECVIDLPLLLWYVSARPKRWFIFPIPLMNSMARTNQSTFPRWMCRWMASNCRTRVHFCDSGRRGAKRERRAGSARHAYAWSAEKRLK